MQTDGDNEAQEGDTIAGEDVSEEAAPEAEQGDEETLAEGEEEEVDKNNEC